jgi:phosphoserine phosphatase
MTPFPWQLVTFDIDGTLTTVHGWQYIAERLGRSVDFEATTQRYRAGEIQVDEHVANLLRIAEGRTLEEIESILEATPRISGISETIDALRSRGACAALLTHNPPYVCQWYVRRFGFDDFEGTIVPPIARGRIPAPGAVRADKIGGLRRLLARQGIPPRRAVHVGDQRQDAELFSLMGGGVALNSRDPVVQGKADRILDTDDLREIVPVLAELEPRAA